MANEPKIVIGADTGAATRALRTLSSELGVTRSSMLGLSGATGMLSGALSVVAFAGFIKKSIDAADNLGKLAQKTGATVEALAGLKFAAEQNELSLEDVAFAAKKLGIQMMEKPAIFKKFGIATNDATEAVVLLADVFKTMPDGVEKTALAVKLFGRSGEAMIPFMNQGTEALRKLTEQGKKLNPVTEESAAQADKFNDQLDEMTTRASTVGVTLGNIMLPELNKVLERISKGTEIFGSFFATLRDNRINSFRGFSTQATEIADEIAKLEAKKAQYQRQNVRTGAIDADLVALKKQREWAVFLSQQSALADNEAYRDEGRRLLPPAKVSKAPTTGSSMLRALGGGDREKNKGKKDAGSSNFADVMRDLDRRTAMLTAENAAEQKLSETYRHSLSILIDVREGKLKLSDTEKLALVGRLETILTLDSETSARERNARAIAAQDDVMASMAGEFDRTIEAARLEMTVMPEALRARQLELLKVADAADKARKATVKLYTDGTINESEKADALARITEEMERQQNATIKLSDEQQRLNASWETGATKALVSYVDNLRNVAKASEEAFTRAFSSMEDAIVDFAMTGKMNFSSLAESVISDIIRIRQRAAMLAMLDSAKESGGFIGSLISSIMGSGGSSGGSAGGSGGTFNGISLPAAANGGVFSGRGISALSGSVVSRPTIVPLARGGVLIGEAGDEAVMPLARGPDGKLGVRSSGGSSVVVNIIESPGNGGQTSQRDEGGKSIIDVMVEQIESKIGGNVARGRGPVAAGMQSRYGLNPVAGAY